MQESRYNGETSSMDSALTGESRAVKPVSGAAAHPFFVSKTLLKRLHKMSGLGRGRATNGARTKPKGYEQKRKRKRKIAAASRKANRR